MNQVIASLLVLGVLIGAGVTVGVILLKRHHTSAASSSSQSDPSTFEKDPRLKQSFYGIAYTPEGVQLPECGAVLGKYLVLAQTVRLLTCIQRMLSQIYRRVQNSWVPNSEWLTDSPLLLAYVTAHYGSYIFFSV